MGIGRTGALCVLPLSKNKRKKCQEEAIVEEGGEKGLFGMVVIVQPDHYLEVESCSLLVTLD